MEDTIEHKKIRISPLLAFLVTIMTIYFLSYLFLRINHDIVHSRIEDKTTQHIIEANMPTGHELFLNTLVKENVPENVDKKLQQKIDFHQSKKKYLDIIFYPVIELEKKCWPLFDQ